MRMNAASCKMSAAWQVRKECFLTAFAEGLCLFNGIPTEFTIGLRDPTLAETCSDDGVCSPAP